jgi:PhoH-like ATPase
MEQYLALQYGLFNPNVELFFLTGSQGSGKTLLSYVSAIDLILEYDSGVSIARGLKDNKNAFFKQIVLLKPNDVMGGSKRDEGTLPGDLYSKIKKHLGPYEDAHKESILGNSIPFKDMILHPNYVNDFGQMRSTDSNKKINNEALFPKHEVIELVSSGYFRGRSFKDTLILVDESQNFTPYETKTIIERAGPGCKCVIMGDPAQFDNPDCSKQINGLTYAIKQNLENPYSCLVNLSENYRSQMSEDAGKWKVFSR